MPEDSTEDVAVSEEQFSGDVDQISENSNEETNAEGEQPTDSSEEINPNLAKINPDDLSPELQAKYKEMQAAFTKDRQEISELRKKAQLYEQQQQQELLNQRFPQQPQKAKQDTNDYLLQALGVDSSQLDPDQKAQVEQLGKIVDAVVQKQLAETVAPLKNDLQLRDYKQELSEVMKKYDDFDNYKDKVRDLVSLNPQLDFEQAYKIASWEEREMKGRTTAIKNLEHKSKQSIPKISPKAAENSKVESFEDAYTYAKQALGK